MDDPSKAEEFLRILDERKKEPIDYREAGNYHVRGDRYISSWLYCNGITFEGIGLLVGP
ncbi:MAG: hypothetical protein Ct9H90mP7_5830 [Candidatus Neomarinimicrobiota bacterium]|nr:MAG: hypothetical protein Ct9H90mP7_5830 [Candidatus Neomarinimicrobiota bacterium]